MSPQVAKSTAEGDSGFYSAAAQKAGGRHAALLALDALVADLELLLVDLDQRIADLSRVAEEREAGVFPGRPPSALEAHFVASRTIDQLSHLRKLRLACRMNLRACEDRFRELRR